MPADALQRLRAKYPQYNDIPDQELARRIISRHPEYQDILGDIAAGPRPVVAPTVAPASQQPLGLGERAYRAAETILGKGTLSPDVLGDVLALTPVGAGVGLAGRAILRGLRGAGIARRALPVAEAVAPTAAQVAEEAVPAAQKIVNALKTATPLRRAQEVLYSAERTRRITEAARAGAEVPGEAGFRRQLGTLAGELPKKQFEPIRPQFGQAEVDELFNQVRQHPLLSDFNRISAQTGLTKLLDGNVPQPKEIELLGRVFGKEFVQVVRNYRGQIPQILDRVALISGIPRSVMASTDFSAPLRQGIFLAPTHTRRFVQAFGQMFRYFGSERALEGLRADITARETFKSGLMDRARLALTGINQAGGITGAEEAFIAANAAEKIPVLGKVVAASDRAYTGFLTKLRADVFDDMVRNLQKAKIPLDDRTLEGVGRFINAATGRGELGRLEPAGDVLSSTLFAPRLIASRLNLLNPLLYATLPAGVRKEALRSLAGFTGLVGSTLGLAKAAGAKVETDLRNADAFKIRVGNTRYDIAGGFQQYLRLGMELAKNETTSSTTGKTTELGKGYGVPTRLDIVKRFVVGKFAPIPSFAAGFLEGRTITGEPFSVPREVAQRVIPLVIQDLRDLIQEEGWVGVPKSIPGFFGVGVQTYRPRRKR